MEINPRNSVQSRLPRVGPTDADLQRQYVPSSEEKCFPEASFKKTPAMERKICPSVDIASSSGNRVEALGCSIEACSKIKYALDALLSDIDPNRNLEKDLGVRESFANSNLAQLMSVGPDFIKECASEISRCTEMIKLRLGFQQPSVNNSLPDPPQDETSTGVRNFYQAYVIYSLAIHDIDELHALLINEGPADFCSSDEINGDMSFVFLMHDYAKELTRMTEIGASIIISIRTKIF